MRPVRRYLAAGASGASRTRVKDRAWSTSTQRKAVDHECASAGRCSLARTPRPVVAPGAVTAPAWRGVALSVGLGLLLLGLVFNKEVLAAVQTWNSSTAYNHCFLVIPIAALFAVGPPCRPRWHPARPMPAAILLGLPLALIWLAVGAAGHHGGPANRRHQLRRVAVPGGSGQAFVVGLAGPLLYLYFLVPFGEFLTPRLQDITTWFIRHGLETLRHSGLYRRLRHRDSARHVLRRRGVCRPALPDRLDRVRLPLRADDVPQPGAPRRVHRGFHRRAGHRQRRSAASGSSTSAICWAVPRPPRPTTSSTAGFSSRS